MDDTSRLATTNSGPGAPKGHARARRLLLRQLHQALATEPAALQPAPHLAGDSLSNIRGRVSIMIGTIVVRLNREGFTESERLYSMRDNLASGRPVASVDVEWLDSIIAVESDT